MTRVTGEVSIQYVPLEQRLFILPIIIPLNRQVAVPNYQNDECDACQKAQFRQFGQQVVV